MEEGKKTFSELMAVFEADKANREIFGEVRKNRLKGLAVEMIGVASRSEILDNLSFFNEWYCEGEEFVVAFTKRTKELDFTWEEYLSIILDPNCLCSLTEAIENELINNPSKNFQDLYYGYVVKLYPEIEPYIAQIAKLDNNDVSLINCPANYARYYLPPSKKSWQISRANEFLVKYAFIKNPTLIETFDFYKRISESPDKETIEALFDLLSSSKQTDEAEDILTVFPFLSDNPVQALCLARYLMLKDSFIDRLKFYRLAVKTNSELVGRAILYAIYTKLETIEEFLEVAPYILGKKEKYEKEFLQKFLKLSPDKETLKRFLSKF